MTQSTGISIKRRGPPSKGGRNLGVMVRVPPDELAAIDTWIAAQPEKATRPEALRRLAKIGLEGEGMAVTATPLGKSE